jgi:hypothetical protein
MGEYWGEVPRVNMDAAKAPIGISKCIGRLS